MAPRISPNRLALGVPGSMPFPTHCPHSPHPPQWLFLTLDCREALYGGAAGGGKSDALLMAALQFVDVPGYSALILRKSFADLALPDAIMSRAKGWLIGQPGVHWNDQTKTFTFASGATLTFGYLQTEADKYRYQGSAYQFIAFDELTQFREDEYTYLISRLRKPNSGPLAAVPLRMRGASNPGGVGHDWVKAYFIPSTDELTGERIFGHGETGEVRVFIPARLEDNPSLDKVEYEKSLALLPPVLRAQLREGDWGAKPAGEMFDRTYFRVVNSVKELPIVRWCRAWDLAGTEKRKAGHDPDWTVGCLMGVTADNRVLIADLRRVRQRPGDVKDLVKAMAEIDRKVFGHRTVRIEQEPGSSGVAVVEDYARTLLGFDFQGVKATGSKTDRAVPLSSAARNGLVYVLAAPWLPDFLSEAESFPQTSVHDDQVDAASLAFETLVTSYAAGSGQIAPAVPGARRSPYHAQRAQVLDRGRTRRLNAA